MPVSNLPGSVRKRPNGLLELRFWIHDGGRRRRISVYGKTKAALEEAYRKSLAQKHAGKILVRRAAPMRVAEVAQEWLAVFLRNARQGDGRWKTWQGYEYACRVFIVPELGERYVSSLGRADIETFLEGLRERRSPRTSRPYSKQVCKNVYSALRALCSYAESKELITANPASSKRIKASLTRAPKYKQEKLSPAKAARFVQACLKVANYGTALALALHTIHREGEILGLRWRNVDLDAGTITFCEQSQQLPRSLRPEGDEDGKIIVQYTKTEGAQDFVRVDLAPAFVKMLRDHRKWQIARRSTVIAAGRTWHQTVKVAIDGRLDNIQEQPNDLLFTGGDGRALDPKTLREAFRRICTQVGVTASARGTAGLRVYDMRGAGATLLASATDPSVAMTANAIMRRAGWRSHQMLQHYSAVFEGVAEQSALKSARSLGLG